MDHRRRASVRFHGSASETAAPGYCNIAETAALLGVSRMTVWRWIRDGKLPAAKLGHRTIRISRDDVEQLLQRSRVAVTEGPNEDMDRDVDDGWRASRPNPATRASTASSHVVQFYESDSFLTRAACDFTVEGLSTGEAVVVIATPAHRGEIEEGLRASSIELSARRARGGYVVEDASTMLSRVMVDGKPDAQHFARAIGDLIVAATRRRRHARVFQEMVALLAVTGSPAAAVSLEQLWNDLQRRHSFSLVCAYPMRILVGEAGAAMFGDVCAQHTAIIPAESFSELTSTDERQRAVALLQQKAHWLDSEITRRKEAEERLQAALQAERVARQTANAAIRVRDEFIAVAAHELKTPLTPLLGQIQVMKRRLTRNHAPDPNQVERSLREIAVQGEKLARRIDQLIGGSQLIAGTLIVERRLTDLAPLVSRIVSRAGAWSDRHAIQLEAPPSLVARVDPFRFEQVLISLLDNAIRFSPAGGPIEVVLACTEPGVAELSVRDHGVGLPTAKRDGLFQRFYSAHSDDYLSGIGLGLYVSRRIVEMHGGEIRAEFPRSGGSRFVVRLPIDRDRDDDDGRLTTAART